RRHTRLQGDWSSDVCSSDLTGQVANVSPWPVSSYAKRPTELKYRYGWITPLVFTPTAPHALLFGAQVLFRSVDRGTHWQVISPRSEERRVGKEGRCGGARDE